MRPFHIPEGAYGTRRTRCRRRVLAADQVLVSLFKEDVAATTCVLALQKGPCILAAHT
jgi:hypothetical protein